MAKPSIFSKDYEKKMKKRRFKIVGGIVIVILLAGGIFYQVKLKNMDFNQIINSLQAWVNSDTQEKPQKPNNDATTKKDNITNEEGETKPAVLDKIVSKEFKLNDTENIKVKMDEKNGDSTFIEVESKEYKSDISPNKKELVVQDSKQNMYIINSNGEIKNITKEDYTSRAGQKYSKVEMMKKEKEAGVDYSWGINPKFIDDNLIVYKSNLPYFGASATNEYLWIYNAKTGTHEAIFDSKNPKIEILDRIQDKGVKVKIGNDEYIITNEGKLLKE